MKQLWVAWVLAIVVGGCVDEVGQDSGQLHWDEEVIEEPRPQVGEVRFTPVGEEVMIEVSWAGRCWSEFFDEEFDCLEQAFEISVECPDDDCVAEPPKIIGSRGEVKVQMLSAGRQWLSFTFTNLATGEVRRKWASGLAMEPDSLLIECFTADDRSCDEADIAPGDRIRARYHVTEGTEYVSADDIFVYSNPRPDQSWQLGSTWEQLDGPLFITISRGEASASYRVIPRMVRDW